MNIKKFALGGFTHIKDNELLSRTNTVIHAISGNVFFPAPEPPLLDLNLLYVDFVEKLAIAQKKGSPEDTAAKQISRQNLVKCLRKLAFYVSDTSDGNLQMLLSSGFEISGYPQNTIFPSLVTGVKLREGRQSGHMRLDFDKQGQALMYEYCYAQETNDPEGLQWTETPFLTTSTKNNILAPLVPLTRYYVQVRAVNGLGKSEWSEPVSYIGR